VLISITSVTNARYIYSLIVAQMGLNRRHFNTYLYVPAYPQYSIRSSASLLRGKIVTIVRIRLSSTSYGSIHMDRQPSICYNINRYHIQLSSLNQRCCPTTMSHSEKNDLSSPHPRRLRLKMILVTLFLPLLVMGYFAGELIGLATGVSLAFIVLVLENQFRPANFSHNDLEQSLRQQAKALTSGLCTTWKFWLEVFAFFSGWIFLGMLYVSTPWSGMGLFAIFMGIILSTYLQMGLAGLFPANLHHKIMLVVKPDGEIVGLDSLAPKHETPIEPLFLEIADQEITQTQTGYYMTIIVYAFWVYILFTSRAFNAESILIFATLSLMMVHAFLGFRTRPLQISWNENELIFESSSEVTRYPLNDLRNVTSNIGIKSSSQKCWIRFQFDQGTELFTTNNEEPQRMIYWLFGLKQQMIKLHLEENQDSMR